MTALLTFRISLYLPDTYPATNARVLQTYLPRAYPLAALPASPAEQWQSNEDLSVSPNRICLLAIYLR